MLTRAILASRCLLDFITMVVLSFGILYGSFGKLTVRSTLLLNKLEGIYVCVINFMLYGCALQTNQADVS